jgi:hypothetical protein
VVDLEVHEHNHDDRNHNDDHAHGLVDRSISRSRAGVKSVAASESLRSA